MLILESYIFEFIVNKEYEKNNYNDDQKIPTHLLAYILTLIVKELRINVEQGRLAITLI